VALSPQDIAVGTRIWVRNGKATKTTPLGRPPFAVWPLGKTWEARDCVDGEEFLITSGPRRGGKPIYQHPEVSGKFVALQRVSDGALLETYYVSVRFDAVETA